MFLIEMFVKVRNVLQFRASISVTSSLRCSSQQATLRSSQASPVGKWDILAAVCIERPAYIVPALSDIEQRTVDMLRQKEFEESMLNDHELRHK